MSASRLTIARRCASPSTTVVSPKGAAPRHNHRARHRARRPLHSSSGPACTCCEWRPPSFGKRTAAAGVGAHRAASRADRAVWGLARSVHSARTRYRRSWRPTPVVDGRVSCEASGARRWEVGGARRWEVGGARHWEVGGDRRCEADGARCCEVGGARCKVGGAS